jgi:cell filamentation protein
VPNYTYDDSETLKNRFGIHDLDRLELLETELPQARIREFLMAEGPRGKFDANHLKAIHRHIFQDVYEWAGRTRDQRVRLSDGTVASEPIMRKPGGKAFTLGPAIPKALTAFATSPRAAKTTSAGCRARHSPIRPRIAWQSSTSSILSVKAMDAHSAFS